MWEVCVISSLPAVFLPSFSSWLFWCQCSFSFQSCRKNVVSGWAYLRFGPNSYQGTLFGALPTQSLKTGDSVAEVEQENSVLIEKETTVCILMAPHCLGFHTSCDKAL